MDFGKLRLAVVTATAATILLGPLSATAQSDLFCNADGCYPIIFSYDYYADAEKTVYLGSAADSCVGDGIVANPYLPTVYYDRTPIYVCTSRGPYMPFDWPY